MRYQTIFTDMNNLNTVVWFQIFLSNRNILFFAQSAGAVEYTDCFSVEWPRYDTKQSDGEVPVMLELWGMRSTPLLPSLSGSLRPGVVAPDKGHIYGLNRT